MKQYDGQSRYQFQPRYVRAWRWLRHVPLAYVRLGWRLTRWMLAGMQSAGDGMGRLETFEMLRTVTRSEADIAMGYWWTLGECRQQLRQAP